MGRQVQQKALEAKALAVRVEKMRKTQAAALGKTSDVSKTLG